MPEHFLFPRAQMRGIDPIVNHAVQLICGPKGRRNSHGTRWRRAERLSKD